MDIKSNSELTSKTKELLQLQCKNIGTIGVSACNESNLAGICSAFVVFERVNSIMKSYKTVLDTDADYIAELGICFTEVDEYLASQSGSV